MTQFAGSEHAAIDGCGVIVWRTMKRWWFTTVVFLLLGAIVNVAVAWGLPAIMDEITWSDDGPPTAEDIEWWQATAPAGREISDEPALVIRNAALGFFSAYMIEHRRTEASQRKGHTCMRRMMGWPMLSFQSTIWEDGARPGRTLTVRGVVFFLSNLWPIEPLWIGTVINTMLYAAVLWGLFAMFFALLRNRRSKRRIKRGLCPACAYPFGESNICSECGLARSETSA
jgi:hypothetical protein